jgi:hypothetical protein
MGRDFRDGREGKPEFVIVYGGVALSGFIMGLLCGWIVRML